MKKILFIFLFLFLCSKADAATLYAKAAGGNYSSANTWSNVNSAGADNSGPPLATDAVIFDSGSSGTVTVDTTTCVASTLVVNASCTGTLTFTASQKLTVTTTVTFVTGFNLSGTGTLQLSNTATITSGGLTFPGSLIFDAGIWTLADNWTVTGSVTTQTSGCTLNETGAGVGDTFTIGGSLSINYTASGTTNIVLNGTGTLSCVSSSVYIGNDLTINTTGTITLGTTVNYQDGTLTYIAGTVNGSANSSTLFIGDSCILDTNGINWYNITINPPTSETITLGSNLTCTNDLIVNTSNDIITTAGAFDISCANFIMDAGSTWNMKSSETLTVTNSIQIQSDDLAAATTCTVKAVTGSTAFLLNYNGTTANCNVSGGVIFTDVDASGGNEIINYNGGALTNTTNITNYDGSDVGTPDYPDVGNVTEDDTVGGATGTYHEATEAEVQSGVHFGASSALTGTYGGGGSGGGASFFTMGN